MYTMYTTGDRHTKSDICFLLFFCFSHIPPQPVFLRPAARCTCTATTIALRQLVRDNWQIHILPTHRTYLLHSYKYNILYPNEKSENTSSTNITSQSIVYSETARRHYSEVLVKVHVCTASTFGLQVAILIINTLSNNCTSTDSFWKEITSLHES